MKITVTVLDGQGMPKKITVEVSNNASLEEIQAAIEKAQQGNKHASLDNR